MSAVLITGCSGAGKSTIAAVFARRGLASIDADDDPSLARFVDPTGAVVVEEPAAPDLAWLARHSWAWNPARLDELIRAAAPATLYVCGGAANELVPHQATFARSMMRRSRSSYAWLLRQMM